MKRRTFLVRSLSLLAMSTTGVALSGCGFQLRGLDQQALGFDTLDLNAPPTAFTDELKRRLNSDGVTLTDDAPLRLNVGSTEVKDVALGGGDLNYEEVELNLAVPFSVQRSSDDAYVLDQQVIEVVTTYQASDGNLLVRDDLRSQAVEALQRDAIRQLLERLSALDRL
ncbi:LPS assembly lipoprotein LptE [Halomonas sp. GXIMD04776]|uniref:LPS-assembly lipoprotein LptE n=1 Tax=Halomonas sp. GXIMD04776 TaxID=3415605 RepID=UPI003C81D650